MRYEHLRLKIHMSHNIYLLSISYETLVKIFDIKKENWLTLITKIWIQPFPSFQIHLLGKSNKNLVSFHHHFNKINHDPNEWLFSQRSHLFQSIIFETKTSADVLNPCCFLRGEWSSSSSTSLIWMLMMLCSIRDVSSLI